MRYKDRRNRKAPNNRKVWQRRVAMLTNRTKDKPNTTREDCRMRTAREHTITNNIHKRKDNNITYNQMAAPEEETKL